MAVVFWCLKWQRHKPLENILKNPDLTSQMNPQTLLLAVSSRNYFLAHITPEQEAEAPSHLLEGEVEEK